ncbi:MAG: hypothetical protein RLZZ419_1509 [Pseudomonadota bacterium]
MNTPTPYDKIGLCNDLGRLSDEIRLNSSYIKADMKTVGIRVNQLMRGNVSFMASWNYVVALVSRSDYPSTETQQLRAGGILQEMVFDLYVSLPKTQQAGLHLSKESWVYLYYRLNY